MNSGTPATDKNPIDIATADFNNDGIPDIVVANDTGLTLTVLLGNGDGTFTLASTPSLCSNPSSVAIGDFNNDGIPDIAVAVPGCDSVTVLLGQGDGFFKAVNTRFDDSLGVATIVAGDFNGDGNLDVAGVWVSDNLTVLLGNGDGTFTAKTLGLVTSGGFAEFMAVSDFNGDGIPDLAVTNPAADTVSIFLGNGDGTFNLTSNPQTGDFPEGIAAADLTGNGDLDLAVTNSRGNSVTILRGDGKGNFTPTGQPLVVGNYPSSITVGDFDGDGILDLAVTNFESDTVSVFLGDGAGNFSPFATSPVTDLGPEFLAAADFNSDGVTDLAVANNIANTVTVLLSATQSSTASTTVQPALSTDQLVASFPGDSTYTASLSSETGTPATLTSPTPGTTFSTYAVTFAWSTGTGVTAYEIRVGTTGVGSSNVYDSGLTTVTSVELAGIPIDSQTVYVQLVSNFSNAPSQAFNYTFTEAAPVPSALTSPTGSTLSTNAVTFAWTAGFGVTTNELRVGTTDAGSSDIYDSGSISATSATVGKIPINGETVYVTLISNFSVAPTQTANYTFTEATPVPSALTSPTATYLSGSSQTFTWSAGVAVTRYAIYVGTTGPGTSDIYDSGSTTATSVALNDIPNNGGMLYVRLASEIDGAWQSENYTFIESGGPAAPAVLTAPTALTLTGSSQTFTWTTGTGVTAYELWVGTTEVSSANIYDSGRINVTHAAVNNIPTGGGTVFVWLLSLIDGAWQTSAYTFTESGGPPTPATLLSPAGSTLPASPQTFTWSAGTGVTKYALRVGTTGFGSTDILATGPTTTTSATVNKIPSSGETVYVGVSSEINGVWHYVAYTFTAP